MKTKRSMMKVIVRKSSCPYVPLNVECNAFIKNGKLITCHRISDGAGTYLRGHERIEWEPIHNTNMEINK